MPAILTIRDETLGQPSTPATAGPGRDSFTLEFPTEQITVRELIRERVYQEVQDYNRRRTEAVAAAGNAGGGGVFKGLVQPTDAEATLNGYRLKTAREIDWKQQYEKACEAYQSNRVLVLVGDHQTESLNETIEITRGTEVTFLRLVPLVGG